MTNMFKIAAALCLGLALASSSWGAVVAPPNEAVSVIAMHRSEGSSGLQILLGLKMSKDNSTDFDAVRLVRLQDSTVVDEKNLPYARFRPGAAPLAAFTSSGALVFVSYSYSGGATLYRVEGGKVSQRKIQLPKLKAGYELRLLRMRLNGDNEAWLMGWGDEGGVWFRISLDGELLSVVKKKEFQNILDAVELGPGEYLTASSEFKPKTKLMEVDLTLSKVNAGNVFTGEKVVVDGWLQASLAEDAGVVVLAATIFPSVLYAHLISHDLSSARSVHLFDARGPVALAAAYLYKGHLLAFVRDVPGCTLLVAHLGIGKVIRRDRLSDRTGTCDSLAVHQVASDVFVAFTVGEYGHPPQGSVLHFVSKSLDALINDAPPQ